MKKVLLVVFLAVVISFNIMSAMQGDVSKDVTEEEIVQYLMAPAASVDAQAAKDKIIWQRIAGEIITNLE